MEFYELFTCAFYPITNVPFITLTRKAAHDISAICGYGTVISFIYAFIHI